MPTRTAVLLACLVFALASTSVAASTLYIVDVNGGPGSDFTQIQPAIDVAISGDSILVRDGTYQPFSVDGKGLVISADTGAVIRILGTSTLRNLPAGERMLVAGLGPVPGPLATVRLQLENNAGFVRVQDSELYGTANPFGGGGAALSADNCRALAIDHYTLGGRPATFALDGSSALSLVGSQASVHDSQLEGAAGANGSPGQPGARGGAALNVQDGTVFLSGSTLTGGAGGHGGMPELVVPCGNGGDGGPALSLGAGNPRVYRRDTPLAGGAAGGAFRDCLPGSPGPLTEITTGVLIEASGPARSLDLVNPVREGQTVTLVFEGTPGDGVWWILSDAPAYQFPVFAGTFLVGPPFTIEFFGFLDGTGQLDVAIPVGELGPILPITIHHQAVFDSASEGLIASGGRAALLLDSTTP